MRSTWTWVLCLLLAWPVVAHADPPRHRIFYQNRTFARLNPLGLINIFQPSYRYRMFDGDGLILEDNFVSVGPDLWVSPAFVRAGIRVDLQPTKLLKLFGAYQYQYHFGTFNQVAAYGSPSSRWSDGAIALQGSRGGTEPGGGHVVYWGGTLQMKVSFIAVRNTMLWEYRDYDLPAGDQFFYSQIWDHLLKDQGFVVVNDLDVIGFIGRKERIRVGARYTYTDAFLEAPGTDGDLPHHRLGPLFSYQFHDKGPGTEFDQPALFLAAQWWLQHPYRTGREQSAALPVIILGFQFQGDLWTKD